MGKRILTISREFGSGGRFIGEEIAKNWGLLITIKRLLRRLQKNRDCLQNLLQRNQNCHRKRDCSRMHLLEEICLENHWKI